MNRFTKSIFTLLVTFLLLPPFALAESNAASGMAQQELILTLYKAIKTALANNTLIREAIEKQKAAVEEKRSAKCDFFPKASASYSYTNLKEKPYAIFGPSEIIMGNKDNYRWDVSLVQPIFTGFALSTIHKMAKLGVDLREMEKKRAILDITRQVKVSSHFRPRELTTKTFSSSVRERVERRVCPPCTKVIKTNKDPTRTVINHHNCCKVE